MPGEHQVFDAPMINKQGAKVAGGLAVVFDASSTDGFKLPSSAEDPAFCGFTVADYNDGVPGAVRRMGSIRVKVSGTVNKGDYGVISGSDGRVKAIVTNATPVRQNVVCMFEESGVANDLVVASVIYPTIQITK